MLLISFAWCFGALLAASFGVNLFLLLQLRKQTAVLREHDRCLAFLAIWLDDVYPMSNYIASATAAPPKQKLPIPQLDPKKAN